ncbi:hypothetical protein AAU61_01220 [Desulfocarbo indianensis]|nr:hypothetical protein AAU61_01220 [Desulfocarbo indianensis]
MNKLIACMNLLALIITLICPAAVLAAAASPSASPPDFTAKLDLAMVGEADVGGGGGFSAMTGRLDLDYKGFSFQYQRNSYQWSDLGQLPFGNGQDDPWESLQKVGISYTHRGAISDNMDYMAMAGVSSTFEEEMEDSYNVQGMMTATYRLTPLWRVSFGLAARYHKVETTLLPIAGISYNLATPQGLFASLGFPVTVVGYRFKHGWSLNWGALEFNNNYYRLADDSTVRPRGFLETRDLISSFWVAYQPRKNIKLEAGIHYLFNRELNTYDQEGENEQDHDVDNAWGGFLRVRLEF